MFRDENPVPRPEPSTPGASCSVPVKTHCMPSAMMPLIRGAPLPRGGDHDQRERGGGQKEEEESDIQGERIQDPDV